MLLRPQFSFLGFLRLTQGYLPDKTCPSGLFWAEMIICLRVQFSGGGKVFLSARSNVDTRHMNTQEDHETTLSEYTRDACAIPLSKIRLVQAALSLRANYSFGLCVTLLERSIFMFSAILYETRGLRSRCFTENDVRLSYVMHECL